MATINYGKPDKRDYENDEAQASAGGSNVNAAFAQQQGNTANTITGNGTADFSHVGSYNYPQDLGTDIGSFVGSGIRGAAGAAAAQYGQKVATDKSLSKYAGSPIYQQGLAMGGSTYQYDDPYGFMSGVTGLNNKIDDALGGFAGSSYGDYKQSPEYQNLADLYRQRGQLAMEDTLGTASQMSGGLDSSYAAAAAQQAYNGYMSNLEQAAQQAYQQQLSNRAQQLGALQGERNSLAGLYGQDYNRGYQADRDTQDDAYKWYFGLENNTMAKKQQELDQQNFEAGMGLNWAQFLDSVRQGDRNFEEGQRQFDEQMLWNREQLGNNLGYKYASLAQRGAGGGGGSSTGQLTPNQAYTAYMKMYSETGDEGWLNQAQAILPNGPSTGRITPPERIGIPTKEKRKGG